MLSKRGTFNLLAVAVLGACLGFTTRTFAAPVSAGDFIIPPEESEGGGYTGHSHQEPDGGWYCHCGDTNNDCKPCDGAVEA